MLLSCHTCYRQFATAGDLVEHTLRCDPDKVKDFMRHLQPVESPCAVGRIETFAPNGSHFKVAAKEVAFPLLQGSALTFICKFNMVPPGMTAESISKLSVAEQRKLSAHVPNSLYLTSTGLKDFKCNQMSEEERAAMPPVTKDASGYCRELHAKKILSDIYLSEDDVSEEKIKSLVIETDKLAKLISKQGKEEIRRVLVSEVRSSTNVDGCSGIINHSNLKEECSKNPAMLKLVFELLDHTVFPDMASAKHTRNDLAKRITTSCGFLFSDGEGSRDAIRLHVSTLWCDVKSDFNKLVKRKETPLQPKPRCAAGSTSNPKRKLDHAPDKSLDLKERLEYGRSRSRGERRELEDKNLELEEEIDKVKNKLRTRDASYLDKPTSHESISIKLQPTMDMLKQELFQCQTCLKKVMEENRRLKEKNREMEKTESLLRNAMEENADLREQVEQMELNHALEMGSARGI